MKADDRRVDVAVEDGAEAKPAPGLTEQEELELEKLSENIAAYFKKANGWKNHLLKSQKNNDADAVAKANAMLMKIKKRVDPLVARQTLLRERQSSSPPQTQDSNLQRQASTGAKRLYQTITKRIAEYSEAVERYRSSEDEQSVELLQANVTTLRAALELIKNKRTLTVARMQLPPELSVREQEIIKQHQEAERRRLAAEAKIVAERRIKVYKKLQAYLKSKLQASTQKEELQKWTNELRQLTHAFKTGVPTPIYHMETVNEEVEVTNPDIKPKMVEVTIVGGTVPKTHANKKVTASVRVDVGFLQTQDSYIIETKDAKCNADGQWEWNESSYLQCLLKTRAVKRLERKKVLVEIVENRGMFRKSAVMAKSMCLLKALQHQCTVELACELLNPDNVRRKIGGSITLRFRVHRCLDKDHREVKLVQRKQLVIDEYPKAPKPIQVAAKATPATTSTAQPQQVPASPVKKPYTEEELEDPLNTQMYVGHLANSKEAEETQMRLAKCKKMNQREQLDTRHMLVSVKVQTIEALYQNNRIDPKQYAGELKTAINRDAHLAKALQGLGRKNECVRVIQRLKNMKAEFMDLKKQGLI